MTGAVVGSTCRGSELGTLRNQEKQVQVEQGKRPSHIRPCVVQLSRVYSKSRGSYGRREQGLALRPSRTSLPTACLFL